jgi:hypothetical protein
LVAMEVTLSGLGTRLGHRLDTCLQLHHGGALIGVQHFAAIFQAVMGANPL